MIQIPNEIEIVMKAIEERGFEVYAAGGCVRDALLGKEPLGWTLATNADLAALTALFPGAAVVNAELGAVRMEAEREEQGEPRTAESGETGVIRTEAAREPEPISVTVAAYRADGAYSGFRMPDGVRFADNIEEDLGRRDFTVNAMAYHPAKGLVDPYDGARDLAEKRIRAVGDPLVRFQEDPLRMLRAARFAAELGFDIHKETLRAISKKSGRLKIVSVYRVRDEFEKLITGAFAGKGLKLLVNLNLMPHIVGDLSRAMTGRAAKQFAVLAENIDKSKQIRERRLALFFICFGKQDALLAIERLKFDEETVERLTKALKYLDTVSLLTTKYELKKFLARHGAETYEFLDGLAKAQRNVYDLSESKIFSRQYMTREIQANGEPVFLWELKVDKDDIIENNIAKGEKADLILEALLHLVHRQPEFNVKETLLEHARRYAWNPLLSASLKMKWLRWRNEMY